MTTTRRKRPARDLRAGQIPLFAGTTDDRRHDTALPAPARRYFVEVDVVRKALSERTRQEVEANG